MTWAGQVAHVVRKDLVRARWLILGWVMLIALLTLQFVAPGVRLGMPLGLSPVMLFVLGAGIAAWIIQEDGPHREGSFWPGLPLAPSAVLAAKVFVAFGVGVGIPLVGQLVTLAAFPMPASDLPWLLARSSVPLGAGITMGLVMGSVTKNLGKAAALLIGTFIALTLVSVVSQLVFPSGPGETRTLGPVSVLLFGPLGALATGVFLLYLYRKGRVRRIHRGVGAVLALGCFTAALMGTSAYDGPGLGDLAHDPWESEASRGAGSHVEVIGLRIWSLQSMPLPSSRSLSGVPLDVRVPSAEGTGIDAQVRTWLEPSFFRLVDAGGTTGVMRAASLRHYPFEAVEGLEQPAISLPMTRPDAEGILAGTLQVEVHGFVVTRELRRLPPLALVPGAAHRVPGHRVTVLGARDSSGGSGEQPGLRIRFEGLPDRRDPHAPARTSLSDGMPAGYRVEIMAPPGSAPHQIRGTSSGSGPARFLLAGVPWINYAVEPYPPLPVGESETVSIGIWEHVRSEPVVFRVPLERITLDTPGAGGPS